MDANGVIAGQMPKFLKKNCPNFNIWVFDIISAALKSHFLTRRKRNKRERSGALGRHQKMQRKTQRKQNVSI